MKVYLSIFPLELSETFPWTTERVVRGEGLDMNNDGRQCLDCSLDETSHQHLSVTLLHSHTVTESPLDLGLIVKPLSLRDKYFACWWWCW